MAPIKSFAELVLRYEPTAIVVLSGDELRVMYANAAARTMAGLAQTDAGEHLDARLLTWAQAMTRELLRQAIRQREPVTIAELENRAAPGPDGGPTYWTVRCMPVDHVDALLLFAQDITEQVRIRRQAEHQAREAQAARQALVERDALLQLALEAAEMAEFDWDLDSGEIRHSASLPKIFGLAPAEGVTRLERILDLIHPDDLQRFRQWSRSGLAETERVSEEFKVVRADGDQRHVAIRAQVVRDRNGDAQRLIGVIVDVTAEWRLRRHLERANRRLERFAGMVAHDLKAPLQTAMGFGSLLARSARERLSAQEREQLALILNAARQMGELIDGVLTYAYTTRAQAVREPVQLEQALAEALDRLRYAVEQSGAQITHDPLPVVPGQRVLLALVLQNLIGNALKYCRGTPHLYISVQEAGGEWVVGVRDSGIGIPADRQRRIFEAFERAHAEGDYPGLGLGLSLVKDAVEHHGGRVWVESYPGKGSSFYFSIPKASAPAAPTPGNGE